MIPEYINLHLDTDLYQISNLHTVASEKMLKISEVDPL
jgi:hypothetical protein